MKSPNGKIYGFSLGAILPALGFSLTWFCCLPIFAGALGAGLAVMGDVLTPWRSYFTVAAVAMLGLAFYQTYKPRKTACAATESCALRANRIRQQLVLWLVALATLALLTIGEWSSWVIYWML
jgi:mannose/fructose/N-acetylgalactosamine-specific phosphotransferase system component IID